MPALFPGVLVACFSVYALYAGIAWLRYGKQQRVDPAVADEHLDRFMPTCEVAERHWIRVAAPVQITFSAAMNCDLAKSRVAQTLIRTRELILGGWAAERPAPHGFAARMKSLGWGELTEVPEREIVMGAVTRPWEANVVFRAVPADDFRDFHEPGYVKIAWTLCAEPSGAHDSIARTETRVSTTDPHSRRMFRRYWAFLSPGVILIRWALLRQVKREAEWRCRVGQTQP